MLNPPKETPIMNFIIWNVRGSNNASFRRHCEAMVKMHKPVMLVLLETRMGEHKRLIEVLNFESLILPAAVGLCRGIVIMWKKDSLKLNDISITTPSIHVMFQVTTDDTNPWLFYAIYASNDFAIRNNLWKELTDLSKNTSSDWVSRGIRQGHHMSPYLFIICMERLSRDINRKVDNKSWYPIKTTNSGPKISHLFFVDDPTLFARANILNCNTITQTLQDFCLKSGQSINHNKSKVVFSSNCTPPECPSLLKPS
ncbi:hypothetical protein KY289_036038 [Solanum tuberosum]|nr:hypothetical protein KY289_036038 [Solanum tuberosum]